MTKARTLADNFAADINAITASTPLTGGGTSGTVTVSIQDGTTSQKGAVQLEDSTASTSTTKASTPSSVKSAYDLANGAIAKSLVDAKGDLLVGSANDTVSRLTVASTAGYLLSVDSAEATGLKWAAPAASSGPAFQAYRNGDQSITNSSTWTKIQWNAENFDTDNCYDSSTNYRFTPNKAGYYMVTHYIKTSASGAGRVICNFFKNGSELLLRGFDSTVSSADYIVGGNATIYLNGTTDYIESFIWMNASVTRTVSSSNAQSAGHFEAIWIRS